MADKNDRRKSPNLTRRQAHIERRYLDRYTGHQESLMQGVAPQTTHIEGRDYSSNAISGRGRDTVVAPYGIVETKVHDVRPERRLLGAGRRKGDFANAMAKGKPVVFDLSKSPKSAFSGKGMLKKVSKKAGALGLGMAALSFAKEAKAFFKGE